MEDRRLILNLFGRPLNTLLLVGLCGVKFEVGNGAKDVESTGMQMINPLSVQARGGIKLKYVVFPVE